jgi:alpha-L-fucosidase 2
MFTPICLSVASLPNRVDPSHTILFDEPAKRFTESCVLGNGRLGAMIFGGRDKEHIVLNESNMWSGSAQDADKPNAYKVLPELRVLGLGVAKR